ncbi:hypothetical protein C6361_31850 [Plantactinospora sp. BC1]|nr:hypothetical protein C6361_31850 [Plantactinospora sp. BC1]
MRQTPGGTIVLEGTLVDPPSTAPLPRRSRPTPGPGGRTRRPRPGPTPTPTATGPAPAAAGPVPDAPPAPHPTEPDVPPTEAGGGDTPDDGTGRRPGTPPIPGARSGGSPGRAAAPADPDWEAPGPAPVTPEPTKTDAARSGAAADDSGPRSAGPAGSSYDESYDEIDIPLDDPDPAPVPDRASAADLDQDRDRDLDRDLDQEPDLDPRAGAASSSGDQVADPDDEAILADLIATQPPARLGGSGPIAGVGITLLVTDLERSIAFYRDLLGFFEIDGGEGNAILASGATRLVLRAIREVAPINRRLVHLNLEVNDVTAVYEELLGKGVKFTYAPRAVNRGAKLELWAAAFRDPDGHGIALTQWRSRATG